jgi:ceramide glucosyltransferase
MSLLSFFITLIILGLIVTAFQIIAVGIATKSGRKRRPGNTKNIQECPREKEFCPPISILKPLKGLDDKLYDNLESFCVQDYPEYEIIFSLQNHNDPAYKVARKVKEKYPEKDISIIVERCEKGLNPKVNNLIPAYKISRYEHILISDSNVSVGPDYLKETAKHMQDPLVGMVCNPIRGIGGRTFGSVFENLHLNSFIIGSVCFLDRFLKMPCVVGKSMLMRKNELEAAGGLIGVRNILAEDYVLGKRIHDLGKRIVLSRYVIDNVNEYWGIKKFLNRHSRWGKLRWRIGGMKYLSELVSNPVFISLLPLLLCGFSTVTALLPVPVAAIKAAGDYILGRKLGSDMKPLSYAFSPVKDILIGFLWIVPILSTTVNWRGNRYIIGKDSMLFPCPERGIWSWKYRLTSAIKARLA